MQDNSLQLAVAQAMQQNHQRNMQQQGAQNRQQYGMPSAFMQYPNDNYSMRQAANPYFLPEPQNLYITQQPDYWNQSNPMQWEDYTQQMQEDYGHYSPPQGAQQAQPAQPSTTMDYTKWLNGSAVGDLGKGFTGELGGFNTLWGYKDAAPPKPGEGATQQDWTNYNTALNTFHQGIKANMNPVDVWSNWGGTF